MSKLVIFLVVIFGIAAIMSSPAPDSKKRERHRIIVPSKVHTVYVTKFVKVPEHHHHHHFVKKEHHHHHHTKKAHEPTFDADSLDLHNLDHHDLDHHDV